MWYCIFTRTYPKIVEMILLVLQSASDLKDVATANNYTVAGILAAICIALGGAVVYLYKSRENLQKDFVLEIKKMTDMVLNMQKSYNDFVDNVNNINNARNN